MEQRLGLGRWLYAHLAGQDVGAQAILTAHPVSVAQGSVNLHQAAMRTFVQRIQCHQPPSKVQRLWAVALTEEPIHQSL